MKRALFLVVPLAASLWALADSPKAAAPSGSSALWDLFRQSFDLFTVLLVLGSVAAVAIIVRVLIDVRQNNIVPARSTDTLEDLAAAGRWSELETFIRRDESFPSLVLREVLARDADDRDARREIAEIATSDQAARWFRKIEPLNIVGNLGPLLGLAGTVWGMILAFTTLGDSGGQAGPTDLSLGISKALFHTLLGLCLAIPCMLIYGFYRGVIDRHCTRGTLVVARVVESLPARKAASTLEPQPAAR